MGNIFVILDDTVTKSEVIQDVIGSKGFLDVVVKKKRLENYYFETVQNLYPEAIWHIIKSPFEFNELLNKLDKYAQMDAKVLHCFSNYVISDESKVLLSYEKLKYIDEEYKGTIGSQIAVLMFQNIGAYMDYLRSVCSGQTSVEAAKKINASFPIEGLVDIGIISNFIQCITGNFDSRFFNRLEGDDYILIKSSTNKKKIQREYNYYHLLPDDMKFWYVMPFDYQETEQNASYKMERLHMTDLAIKWVHGSIDETEFEELMDKYFYFFKSRHVRIVDQNTFQKISNELYVDKVLERVETLEQAGEYTAIASLMAAGCQEKTIRNVVQKYFNLKEKIESENKYACISVIGHGDPCFANALYNRSTKTLKFIDPKGALTEDELWTDPYYDLAKLSHSVCGCYDFFNNALFDIRLNEHLEFELDIAFDNTMYIDIFKKKLAENGYDYKTVRLYEASLFLSMLPLHIDYPQKVFGFILNAINILKELESYV